MYGLHQLAGGGVRNYAGRGGGRGYRHPYAVLLALQLVHKIANLRRKPPLTLALMACMTVLHLQPQAFQDLFLSTGMNASPSLWSWLAGGGGDHVRGLCLQPAIMLDSYQRTGIPDLRRLLISPFVHGDDFHLYYNMASFLLKGVSLELRMGTQAFAVLLAFSLVTSQILMCVCSWVLLAFFNMPGPMNTCTVGFSGIIFALKYVLSRRSPGVTTFVGFRVHTRYATWLELLLISLLVPNASFMGHLCGIVAGIIYVEVPIVCSVLSLISGWTLFNRAPSYTYSSGTTTGTSGSARSAPAPRQRNGGQRRGNERPGTAQPHNPAYGADSSPESEEAAIQEALRRSMLDTGGREAPNGGGSAGGPSERGGREGGEGGSAEAVRFTPSAPPSEGVSAAGGGGEGGVSRGEVRRRRLERLGVDV